jgi:DNA-binding NarL/FixJ family response regulator
MRMPTMVVDDQPDVRFLIRLLIDKANDGLVVVAEAGSGAEALDRAAESEPLVVVMDEMMPGMNGIEAAGELKRTNPSQVIILCTAYLDDDLIARAHEAGILHCISKEQVGDLPQFIRRAVASS